MYGNTTSVLPNQDPNARQLADIFDEIYGTGKNILNNGIESIEREAGNYVDQTLKQTLGTEPNKQQYGGMPPQQSYEEMMKQQTQSNNGGCQLCQKAKQVNPLIYGLVSAGIGKLAGLGWVTSAGVGVGTAGAKYLLVDRKQK